METTSPDPLKQLRRILARHPSTTAEEIAGRLGVGVAQASYALAAARRRPPRPRTAAGALHELLECVLQCEAEWRLDDRLRILDMTGDR